MWAIIKKELKSYFYSPIGYIFIGLFLAMFSLIFYITLGEKQTTFQFVFFSAVMYILIFLIPFLTMRLFSEERKSGTEQLLLTSPVSVTKIVFGKFIAATCIIIITELFTLIYFAIISFFKTPEILIVLTTMLGFLLVSMAYISLGMFISSLTENQIISGISTFVIFIFTWLAPRLNIKFIGISLIEKFVPFVTGFFPIKEIISLITIILMFNILTIIVIKRRKFIQ